MKIEDIFSNFPTLESERIRLRKLTSHDAESLFNYASNPEVTKYVTWETHHTIEDSKQFINYVLELYKESKIAPFAIEDKSTGKLIGTADFVSWNTNHHNGEIGYVLSPDYWGKGIVPEVVNLLLKFGFNQMNMERIQARCFVENNASERVMQKVGMKFEGISRHAMFIKGQFVDLKIYAIIKNDYLLLTK
ncbi:GNAT family N-acetyltransferase [Bacillus sp. EAC]|uniref:GNAT family N-acetyltransferase n=1 Tax=Bacillus sp. EAC TaxID=1978338 RepID=UPI000B450CC1|nr:GNAT family protein [Bacillus sp. EAC]